MVKKKSVYDRMAETATKKRARAPSTASLTKLSKLGERLAVQNALVVTLEVQLAEEKKFLENLKINELPGAMAEVGMSEFSLSNGTKFKTKAFYAASYVEGMRDKAFAWMKKNGFGDLVKHEISIPIAMGQAKEQKAIVAWLRKQGHTFKDGETVHGNTLKAFVKRHLESGESFPEDLFKIHSGTTIVIQEPK
jgi:hypothetical protein